MVRVLTTRTRETSVTTGTGDIVLAGAVAGHRPFSEGVADGDTIPYLVEMGNDFEYGIGTYRTAGPVIERTRIRQSNNADAAVNWGAGTKQVWLYADPEDLVSPYERQDTATSNQQDDLTFFGSGNWKDLALGDVTPGGFGNFPVASQAEAQAGTSNVRYMTPRRTTDLIHGRRLPEVVTDGATVTVDLSLRDSFEVTLEGNRTLALVNPTTGQSVLVRVIQDGTGTRLLGYPASVKWPDDIEPTLTVTAGSSNWLGFKCVNSTTPVYHGFVVGGPYAS